MSEEKLPKSQDGPTTSGEDDYFAQYWRYCAAVRNWLVAFGVGGCVLLISEKSGLFKDIVGQMRATILCLFMTGVIVQILLALINKWIHWYLYRGVGDPKFRTRWLYKTSDRISTWFILDIFADVISCAAYIVGAWMMFKNLPFDGSS